MNLNMNYNVVMFMFKQIICTLTFELSYTVSFESSKLIVSQIVNSFVMFIRVVIVMQHVISFQYHKNRTCFSDDQVINKMRSCSVVVKQKLV